MHLHIISAVEPKYFMNSHIASYRLRLSYVYDAAIQLGYKVTGSLKFNENADIYYIGKISNNMGGEVRELIENIKKKKSIVLIDYTDDLLDSADYIKRMKIYEELMEINSIAIVPVDGLAEKLINMGKNAHVIPDGVDNINISNPIFKKNKTKNVLWHGHSSNINSLLRVLENDLKDYEFNLHLVSNTNSFEVLKNKKFIQIPKCNPVGHLWSIKTLNSVAHRCDFALLPSDKKWASANRLVTNFRLGLPTIAESISSYKKFSRYYCNFDKKNISNMFNFHQNWHYLVKLAQNKTTKEFSRQRLINLWKKILSVRRLQ